MRWNTRHDPIWSLGAAIWWISHDYGTVSNGANGLAGFFLSTIRGVDIQGGCIPTRACAFMQSFTAQLHKSRTARIAFTLDGQLIACKGFWVVEAWCLSKYNDRQPPFYPTVTYYSIYFFNSNSWSSCSWHSPWVVFQAVPCRRVFFLFWRCFWFSDTWKREAVCTVSLA